MTETCPGCHVVLDAIDGPVHRYIGASPGCWAQYTRLLAWDPPMGGATLLPLLVDAYAAQHPGGNSAQATQSVAVHLVVLESVLGHGMPLDRLAPLRVAAVEIGRRGQAYPKLEPAPGSWELTVVDIVGEDTEPERAVTCDRYVRSVWEAWKGLHGPVVDGWQRAAVSQLDR